jgi:hypothetical protein
MPCLHAAADGVGSLSAAASNGSCSSQQQQQQQQNVSQQRHQQRGLHYIQLQQQQQLQGAWGALPLLRSHPPSLYQQLTQHQALTWPGSCRAFSSSSSSSSALQKLTCIPATAAATAGLSRLLPTTSWQLGQQLQQQRSVRQMLPFDVAPKPLPRFRKPNKDGRMNHMVIRIPPQVQVQLQDQAITLTGAANVRSTARGMNSLG